MTELRRAAAAERLVGDRPRLSIDPPDLVAVRLAAHRPARPDRVAIAADAARAARVGDAMGAHALALIDLRWGVPSAAVVARAIHLLGLAAASAADPASMLADLAAARLMYAERSRDGAALAAALEAAAEALDRQPALPQARYNLTLALHRAGLTATAATSAGAFLARDSVSAWAAALRTIAGPPSVVGDSAVPDAHADSTALAAFVRRDHGAAREFGWSVALGRWVETTDGHDAAGPAAGLALAERVGRALVADGGDASLLDVCVALRRADDRHAVTASARAVRAYHTGEASLAAGDYTSARAALARVDDAEGVPTVLRLWAQALLGAADVHAGHPASGVRVLRAVLTRVDTVRYPALAGRAAASLGTAALRAGDDSSAAVFVATAERHLSRAGEMERLGAVQFLRTDAEFARGASADGYATAWRALGTLRSRPHSVWRHNVLYVVAQEAALDGMPRAAALLQDEGVAAAEGTGRPLDLAEALLARSRLRAAAGAASDAWADIRRARELIAGASDGSDRAWMAADLDLSLAYALLATSPALAATHADRAVHFFGSRRIVLRLVSALATRAEAHAASGDAAAAVRDLEAAIGLLDERAARLRDAQARAALLTGARRVLDRLVLLRLAQADPAAALRDLERVRALLGGHGGAQDVRRAAPGRVAAGRETAVVYARVADTLLTWSVTGRDTQFLRSVAPAQDLDDTLARVVAALELRQPDAQIVPLLARLYDTLIRPVQDRLGGAGQPMVIITDGSLAAVPFAALYDRRKRRYLVEDRALRFASSLADADAPSPGSMLRRGRDPHDVLLVGDPAFPADAFPSLERLPGAAAEVDSLAGVYLGARVITGDAATGDLVVSGLAGARVMHYAGHAVFDAARPERSHLVLASSAGGSARLDADAVARLSLRRTRLVVLAACQTVGATAGSLDGLAGVAGAFRTAGATGVIGATWRVDDALTRPLMVAVHRAYAASGDGPGSLRAAQLQMLRSPDATLRTPAAWSGFHYVGR